MNIFFDGWQSIGRALLAGFVAYLGLVVLLRSSGKRTLSKLNAFDLVVTVALGSILATIILSKDVTVATGVTAMAVLISMQYVIAALSVRYHNVRRVTRSEPRLLLRSGTLLRDAMRSERITEDEVLQALRARGYSSAQDIDAVVLETDGSLSVLVSASMRDAAMPSAGDGSGRHE